MTPPTIRTNINRLAATGFLVNQAMAVCMVSSDQPVIWRGPLVFSAIKQFLKDVRWDDLEYLIVDMPPGTGDAQLTLSQRVRLSGAVIVTTPQDVALADAIKGINMFAGEKINVPLLGIIENMSWFTPEELPGNKYYIFGKDGCKNLAEKMGIPLLGQVPIVQGIRESGNQRI